MFNYLFKNDMNAQRPSCAERHYVYEAGIRKSEIRDVERACARLFSTDDGRKVLAHLQVMTFHRAMGGQAADQELRYVEGQRALVASILRMIERGRQ